MHNILSGNWSTARVICRNWLLQGLNSIFQSIPKFLVWEGPAGAFRIRLCVLFMVKYTIRENQIQYTYGMKLHDTNLQ